MGPRPIGRGNAIGGVDRSLVVEASMGPRPIGRGNVAAAIDIAPESIASMGPRPIGRGNGKYGLGVLGVYWLQWGRDQLVAEMLLSLPNLAISTPASMGPRPIGRGNYDCFCELAHQS